MIDSSSTVPERLSKWEVQYPSPKGRCCDSLKAVGFVGFEKIPRITYSNISRDRSWIYCNWSNNTTFDFQCGALKHTLYTYRTNHVIKMMRNAFIKGHFKLVTPCISVCTVQVKDSTQKENV